VITILTVGKRHDPLLADAINDYEKRLRAPFDVKWVNLAHSPADGPAARHSESQAIVAMLKPGDYVILLDERGRLLDSPQLSTRLATVAASAKPVVIVIGGAYGVDETLHERADLVWSLSPLVFPHRLVRLMLTEQLYRAQSIQTGSRYHHE
jgi:23S rRNA (pseudouridine1915-N3)-methyltransferase